VSPKFSATGQAWPAACPLLVQEHERNVWFVGTRCCRGLAFPAVSAKYHVWPGLVMTTRIAKGARANETSLDALQVGKMSVARPAAVLATLEPNVGWDGRYCFHEFCVRCPCLLLQCTFGGWLNICGAVWSPAWRSSLTHTQGQEHSSLVSFGQQLQAHT
jgi:hypothetical protein